MRYQYEEFPYVTPAALAEGRAEDRCAVAIVGAGPVGLALAIDLALRGQPSVLLDDNNVVSVGSRAICWSKRTLEIFDRLGVGQRMLDKGVTWKVGRLYEGEEEVFAFDLLPEDGHRMPAFVNLQQYYVEQYLVERARDFPDLIDLRFRNEVTGIEPHADGAVLAVRTPDGPYRLHADWTVACDGVRSPIRTMLGLPFEGVGFEERFLIADIEMTADYPSDRRYWFRPPFHPEHSVLMHKQPDDIWRIDWQLGRDADPEAERDEARIRERVARVVGGRPFKLDWVSIYAFQCRRMPHFVQGRTIFAGDSAHVVSPFGARGGNGGVQDADNLAWKLASVIRGEAPEGLIASYDAERTAAADENILNSTRATNFISPKAGTERVYRDAVLALARRAPFARRMVNTGRLSTPKWLDESPLNGPDASLPHATRPGAPCADAPLAEGWLLGALGEGFVLMSLGAAAGAELPGAAPLSIPEPGPHLRARYLGEEPGAVYLIRPDQHVAARWTDWDAGQGARALARCLGRAA